MDAETAHTHTYVIVPSSNTVCERHLYNCHLYQQEYQPLSISRH